MEGVGGGDPLDLGGQGGIGEDPPGVDHLHAPPEHRLRRHLRPGAAVADVKQSTWNDNDHAYDHDNDNDYDDNDDDDKDVKQSTWNGARFRF